VQAGYSALDGLFGVALQRHGSLGVADVQDHRVVVPGLERGGANSSGAGGAGEFWIAGRGGIRWPGAEWDMDRLLNVTLSGVVGRLAALGGTAEAAVPTGAIRGRQRTNFRTLSRW
jgi:hypothetical protein